MSGRKTTGQHGELRAPEQFRAALAAAGYPAARVTDIPVRTSARAPGRAPEGFGQLLSVLARSRTHVAGQSSPDLNPG